MTTKGLNSESYRGSGLALRLPPTSPRGRLLESGKMFVNGWVKSVTLHSALPPETLPLVRITAADYRLTNLDVLLSNGSAAF